MAASLGIGVVQLNFGLNMVFGLSEGRGMQIALVALAVGVAAISAVSGVDKGIKRLSEANVYLATALLLFVLFTGRTGWLLNSVVKNMGDYLAWLPRWTFETFSYSQDPAATADWMANWTLVFWAWWVAWAPFVGLFLARVSRGRTFRQFVIGTLCVPFLFVALWTSILGNTALDRAVNNKDHDFLQTAVDSPERGFYTLLDGLPGGIAMLQMATLIMGLPFMVVVYLIMVGLMRSIRMETAQVDSRAIALHSAISGRTLPSGNDLDWENRLDRTSTWPSEQTAHRYVVQIAKPALESVATALRARDFDATLLVADSKDTKVPQLDLSVVFGEDPVFRYTRAQLINNVLDLFDRHLEYLHMQQGFSGERDLTEFTSDAPEWGEDFGKQ